MPFVAKAMIENGCDILFWKPILNSYQKRNNQIVKALDYLFHIAEDTGIRHLFVSENFAALLATGTDIGLFASSDVDLVADVEEAPLIKNIFQKLGYICKNHCKNSNEEIFISYYSNGEILPKDFVFNVNWSLFPRKYLPEIVSTQKVVDFRTLQNIKDTKIKVPSTSSLLYICLLHISLHSFCRKPGIRLYCDIVNMQKICSVENWKEVMAFAAKDELLRRVITATLVSKHLGIARIPQNMFARDLHCRLLLLLVCKKNGIRDNATKALLVRSIELLCDDKGIVHALQSIHRHLKEQKINK